MEIANEPNPRWKLLQQIWAVFALVLFIVTFRLWLPANDFPAIPLFTAFASPVFQSVWTHYPLLALCGVSLLASIIKPHPRLWLLILSSLVLMFLLNQHHLQPWAFHLGLGATVFATCAANDGARLLRVLCISIYVFSAVGKFDYQFIYTVGQQFLNAAVGLIGQNTDALSPELGAKLTLVFPVFELLVGVLLSFTKTRKIGIIAAVILHTNIILILSPLGLGHNPGVIIWNGLFIALIPILFVIPSKFPVETKVSSGSRIAWWVIMAASLLPILEPFGKYDHWLAWGLYSPRTSRVEINIHSYKVGELPELEPYLLPPSGKTPFRELDIRKWSLAELHVPIYPQDRFQLAVARYLAHRYKLESGIEVHLMGIADRFTGKRDIEILRGTREVDMRCQRFLFSTDSFNAAN